LRIVAIENGDAARLEPGKDLRLGISDLLDRAEIFQMHRLDRRDDRDVRTHELGQRRDLAGMIHAHLEHRIARRLGAERERQRHAPMIVVGFGRGMRLPVARQREPQRLLGAGLADRAGDADDFRRTTRARRAGKAAQAFEHIGHDEERRVVRQLCAFLGGDDRQTGAGFQCGFDEFMTVTCIGEREKRIGFLQRAAVDGKAGDSARQRALFAGRHCGGHRIWCPERASGHAHFLLSAAATAS
jgi:hypothetical protein